MTSDNDSIESRLKGYIETVKGRALDFDLSQLPSKHLINDLALDSLDIINVLFQIEENEKVDITEADMESHSLFDFESLANHIREKKQV
jgi:acyl carrier protein